MTTRIRAQQPVGLGTIGWIHYHRSDNIENLDLNDEEVAIKEASLFYRAGGKTIVDLTNLGLGRDPQALARISRATGLNIIMGSGYYREGSPRDAEMRAKSEEEIADDIVRDIMIGDYGICAGIIGEIAAHLWPMSDVEAKSVRAAAQAQRATGAAINIHPGETEESALEILRVLGKAGADISRVVMSHPDRTGYSFDSMVEIAKAGCYVELDIFGREGYYPLRWGVHEMPNDAQRVNHIIRLADKGYLNQILMSHDICMKANLTTYGGHGYTHIIENVIPWMRAKGMSEEEINTITVENPKRILTFVAPANH